MTPEKINSTQLIRRLRSAQGHLQTVTGMVEAGEPCEQALHQLNAVQGALKAAAQRNSSPSNRKEIDLCLNNLKN